MKKKLLLLFIVLLPYAFIIRQYGEFADHYDYLVSMYFKTMENSYFLGCADTKSTNLKECHRRAKELAQGLNDSLKKIK